jgi:capsular polysaccharide transport system permease protein
MNAEQSFPIEGIPIEAGRIEAEAPERRRNALSAWLKKRRWFVLAVVVPTLLAAIYYGFFASDIYVSESRFVIKSPDEKKAQMSSLANLIQTTGLSGGQEQTNEVLEYVRSRDALKALERAPGFRTAFSAPHGDILSRFPQPFFSHSFEALYKFYGKMVDAELDKETGTAIVKVRAFSPDDARTINERLLQLSEALVNRLNARVQNHGIEEAQRQVDLATERALEARVAMERYRNSQEVIDPARQAVGVLEISNTMTAQRAVLQAQLAQMQQVAPNNPSIPALRQRIAAISAQISTQEGRVVGTRGGMASKLGGYENLAVEQEFATKSLEVANAALVQARAEAVRQQFYLERVVEPNLPDYAMLPSRLLSVLVVAALATCLYFIGWMLIVGMLEHAPDE